MTMGEKRSGGTTSVVTMLESTLDSVDVAEGIVLKAAEEIGFAEEVRYQIGMAVRESMVNAVVHGNRYNENKRVRLEVQKEPDKLTIKVADEGRGFDPKDLPDPLAEENLMNQSGRGIFLIQAFMDEFEVRRAEPAGTEYTLVKHKK